MQASERCQACGSLLQASKCGGNAFLAQSQQRWQIECKICEIFFPQNLKETPVEKQAELKRFFFCVIYV